MPTFYDILDEIEEAYEEADWEEALKKLTEAREFIETLQNQGRN